MLTKTRKVPDDNNPEYPQWSRLPTTPLTGIYQNLGDFDRLSMARVCKAWYQGFHVPALWRSRTIYFGVRRTTREIEEEALMKSEKALLTSYGKYASEFAKEFPISLQDVEIDLMPLEGREGEEIASDFKTFSACLDDAKLRTIAIYSLELDTVGQQMRTDLIASLQRLVHNQHCLRKFQMKSSHFDLESGLQFIRCLADASAATLKELNVYGLFQEGLSIYREGRVLTELQRFTGLTCIHLDYDVMSEELAKAWVRGCPNLSSVTLCAKGYVQLSHGISCEAWKTLVSSHPHLLVELRASLIQDTMQMLDILSPAIPLFKLSWDAYDWDTTEFGLTRLLNRVANYHRTIKHLYLRLSGLFPNFDTTTVQNLLSKCTHLLPFTCKNFETFTYGNTNGYTWSLSQ